jgi:hypothetical protein
MLLSECSDCPVPAVSTSPGALACEQAFIQVGLDLGWIFGKPRCASEGHLQLDGGFLKNGAIHCRKHKSSCQIKPMKITLPSYCEVTRIFSGTALRSVSIY